MNKLLGVAVVMVLILDLPVQAQRINKKATEKSTWYEAPREIQILDDRPVIRDFREAPSSGNDSIALPPAPGGGGGGSPTTLPAGGMHLGGPNQGFRTAPAGLGSLPKSGFGGTNIPAAGLGPRGSLPGVKQSVMGQRRASSAKPTGGMSAGQSSGPAVSSYSGGYGSGAGPATGGSSSRTESMVRGTLLKGK